MIVNGSVSTNSFIFRNRPMRPTISRLWITALLLTTGLMARSQAPPRTPVPRTPEYTFKIVQMFPHDPQAFTQGFFYHDGFLYEGTGMNGSSSLRKVKLETGEVMQHVDLDQQYFGEGIALVDDRIVQLTWQSGVAFVYNAKDFQLLRRFSYKGEAGG